MHPRFIAADVDQNGEKDYILLGYKDNQLSFVVYNENNERLPVPHPSERQKIVNLSQKPPESYQKFFDQSAGSWWQLDRRFAYTDQCYLEYRRALIINEEGEAMGIDFNGAIFHYCLTQDSMIMTDFKIIDTERILNPDFQKLDLDKDGSEEIVISGGNGPASFVLIYSVNQHNFLRLKGKIPSSENNHIKLIDQGDFIEIETMSAAYHMYHADEHPYKLVEKYIKSGNRIIQLSSIKIPIENDD